MRDAEITTQSHVFSKRQQLAGPLALMGWPSVDLKLLQHEVPHLGQKGRTRKKLEVIYGPACYIRSFGPLHAGALGCQLHHKG